MGHLLLFGTLGFPFYLGQLLPGTLVTLIYLGQLLRCFLVL
jgi:hypothetical protein